MPDVEHLHFGAREQAQPEFGAAVRRTAGAGGIFRDAVAQHPVAEADGTAVAPAPGHPIAARGGNRLAGGVQRAGQHALAGPEDGPRNVLLQCPGEAAVAGGDDGAPAQRAVLARQLLDHREELERRQFRAADRPRQPHAEQVRRAQFIDQPARKLTVLVELAPQLRDHRLQAPGARKKCCLRHAISHNRVNSNLRGRMQVAMRPLAVAGHRIT